MWPFAREEMEFAPRLFPLLFFITPCLLGPDRKFLLVPGDLQEENANEALR